MLTALEIENFKGIATRQRIDFAPLTLLFGANSAGKSTILQALLYLHEILERGAADVDRTELGGNLLELGGFARLVHRNQLNHAMVLKVEFATPGSLERFGRDLRDFPMPDLDDEINSAWLELTIRFRSEATFQGGVVDAIRVGVNQHLEPLVRLSLGHSLREGEPLFASVNTKHPVLAAMHEEELASWLDLAVPTRTQPSLFPSDDEIDVPEELKADQDSSFPVFAVSRTWISALPSFRDPLRVLVPGGDEPTRKERVAAEQIRIFLEMVLLGTTAQLEAFLRDCLYIGPLRTLPPRGFLYESSGRRASWADGLAAWDALLSDRLDLIERTNHWLQRLGVRCEIFVKVLPDVDVGIEESGESSVDWTVRRLLLETATGSVVLPSEVGAGVSQIVPVIVAALVRSSGLILIEQPEIHVHPAVQVNLGDLFIETAMSEGGRRILLVETHSEHLILRLLRRIRETSEAELPEGVTAFVAEKLSVLYVENDADGVRIRQLRVDEQGEFKDRWPKGFFAERMEELL